MAAMRLCKQEQRCCGKIKNTTAIKSNETGSPYERNNRTGKLTNHKITITTAIYKTTKNNNHKHKNGFEH